jgi:hypothetical protein
MAQPQVAAPASRTDGDITFTFTLTHEDMAPGLTLASKSIQMIVPAYSAFLGYMVGSSFGPAVQAALAVGFAAMGWFWGARLSVVRARAALANKSDAERTFTWRFTPQGYEVGTVNSFARGDWSSVHRFIEGPKTFVLYPSELALHVIPKAALHPEDVPLLSKLLASRIAPRKKSRVLGREFLVWFVIIFVVMMLPTIWQMLQGDP